MGKGIFEYQCQNKKCNTINEKVLDRNDLPKHVNCNVCGKLCTRYYGSVSFIGNTGSEASTPSKQL